jgi:hypothetical protein
MTTRKKITDRVVGVRISMEGSPKRPRIQQPGESGGFFDTGSVTDVGR